MRSGKTWAIKCEDKLVNSVIEPVTPMEIPAESQPHALLTFTQSSNKRLAYVFRIDGKIGPTMYYAEPRWVCFNNTSGAPGSDPNYAKLNVPITPGHHVIEYSQGYPFMGKNFVFNSVYVIEFDAKEGKTYNFVMELDKPDMKKAAQEKIIEQ